ncbi:alpha/beta hydrolase [Bacillus sp. SG-1]|uniref:alpha/beta hydrolase n=1 Tax=Bacillus sp. SG-1 TaxID=161544 RepID=UPI0002DE9221|nr:alpha/beta fold hydrolase [Bacillus sp. SG-1]
MIFLPAAGFSGNEGLNIGDYLSGEFETHLIDLPGLGKSKGIEGRITAIQLADWVNEYMEQMQMEQANLIGHSLGGAILLAFAVHYPHKVNKLILLDQGHKPFPRIPKSEFGPFAYAFPMLNVCVKLFGKPFLKKLEPLFSQNEEQENPFDLTVEKFCNRVFIKENDYIRTALKHPAEFSLSGLNLMFGYYNLNLPNLLKKLRTPTYLIYSTFEDLDENESKSTEYYINRIKRHTLPITYQPVRGGHYVHWNEEFSMVNIRNFLLSTY